MRALKTVALSLVVGLLSVTGSSAQFANPDVALAGRAGAMTCGEFTHLSPGHRSSIVRGLNTSAPPRSLAPMVSVPGTTGRPGAGHVVIENRSTLQNMQLTAGILVAACQAAQPSESLRSAFDQFDNGHRVVLHRRR